MMENIEDYKWAKAKDILLADALIDLKKKNQTDFWVVVDRVIEAWKSRNPKQWASHIIDVGNLRETRADKYGSNRKVKKKASIMDMRYLVDVPQWIILVLRKLYNVDELPMNKEFFREFAKRYPAFRVAEKI